MDLLRAVAHEVRLGITAVERGSSTEISRFAQSIVEGNRAVLLEVHTEMIQKYAELFVAVFINAIKETNMSNLISTIAFEFKGLNVSFWIVLKSTENTFEDSAKFYALYSKIVNDEIFKRLNIHFSVFAEDELDIPDSFQKFNPN
ncbi:MAG: hypothetical protein HY800_05650 [Ignavibacteriales bacterium]|nr:hypothetical protein [Ignavibacteriales bacterium]